MTPFRSRAILTPDGEIKLPDQQALRDYATLGNAGTVIVTVQRRVNRRSLDQNALYWGPVITAVMKTSGQFDGPEATHEYLKRKYGVKSTKAMSRDAFTVYVSSIIADGAQGDFGPDWDWSDEAAEREIAT